ncbi:hypothetical protein D3C73_426880 [compost metagenome]
MTLTSTISALLPGSAGRSGGKAAPSMRGAASAMSKVDRFIPCLSSGPVLHCASAQRMPGERGNADRPVLVASQDNIFVLARYVLPR